jgi:hypothetical protein
VLSLQVGDRFAAQAHPDSTKQRQEGPICHAFPVPARSAALLLAFSQRCRAARRPRRRIAVPRMAQKPPYEHRVASWSKNGWCLGQGNSRSAVFSGSFWSHPPGSNRRPADYEELSPAPNAPLALYGSACYQQLGEAALAQIATPCTSNGWDFGTVLAQVVRETSAGNPPVPPISPVGRHAELLLPRRCPKRCLSFQFRSASPMVGAEKTLAYGREHSRPNSVGRAGNKRPIVYDQLSGSGT